MFYYFNELSERLTNTEIMVFSFIHAIYYRNLNEDEERFFICSNDYICEKLNLSQPTVSKAIKTLTQKGFIKIKYEKNPNGQTRFLFPKLIELEDVFEETPKKKLYEGGKKTFYNSIKKSFTSPYKNLLHNNNNINNNNNNNNNTKPTEEIKKDYRANALIVASNDDTFVKDKWNEIAKRYDLATISTITATRRSHLLQRFQEAGGKEMFFKIVESAIKGSEFLRGKNSKKWKATFDFFLRQSSFVKSAEGAYNTRSRMSPVIKAVTDQDDEISNDDLFAEFAFGKN